MQNPKKYSYAFVPATKLALRALMDGPLLRTFRHSSGRAGRYSDGARGYSHKTINELVEQGVAVRIGRGVVLAEHIERLNNDRQSGHLPRHSRS